MPLKPTDPDELERVVASYLGGELRNGEVPIGAKHVPDAKRPALVAHFAGKGFELSVKEHKVEKELVVLGLQRREMPSPEAPVVHTETPKKR